MKYIDADKLIAEIERFSSTEYSDNTFGDDVANGALDYVLEEIIPSLQQEQPKKRIIQVKCLYPYDESWQKNKIYTCEVWHHGDLNRDFWDVYYDYGKDPRYVQFSSIGRLNEEFVVVQKQPEVDLEKEIVSICETYGITKNFDAELGPLDIKNIAHHFYELGLNARK